jgi:hypothetical protein
MCDCLAWHPAWAVAAKRAGTKPGIVFAVFMALRHGGPYPLDARSIAMGLGFKPAQVALVLSALIEAEIVDEALHPIGEWSVTERDSVTDNVTNVTVTGLERKRALDRERQRRFRAKKTAEIHEFPAPRLAPKAERDVSRDGPALLEEEDQAIQSISSPEDTRVDGPPAFLRKRGWAMSTLQKAQQADKVSPGEAGRLWNEILLMRPDPSIRNWGLSRRANDELDRLEHILGGQLVPPHRQRSLLLPMDGATA